MNVEEVKPRNKGVGSACLSSGFIPFLWPMLVVVGLVWGIVYAAQGKVGPALAVWGSSWLGFFTAIVLYIYLGP